MLKPFKSFLTYLQKNTNGGNIFGLSPNSNEDEQQEVGDDGDACPEVLIDPIDDPLNTSGEMYNSVDPLALDVSGVDDSGLNTSIDGEPTVGEIIIVDVNALTKHNKSPLRIPKTNSHLDTVDDIGDVDPDDDDDEDDVSAAFDLEKRILPPSTHGTSTNDESQEERSDGSDSGIGPEPSSDLLTSIDEKNCTASDIFNLTDVSTSTALPASNAGSSQTSPNPSPLKSIHLQPARSSLKRRADTELGDVPKRQKRSISFDGGVTVFYFPRIQGFACVPSQGGCTLGMGPHHIHSRKFSMTEHAAEQRRVHRQQLNELNPRGSSSDDSDSDEEISESGSEIDTETTGFLQPVTTRQRRALLKLAGIRKIDTNEKDECRVIRSSREFCGCNCRGYCDPDTCFCSQSGIKCQVDRPNFPCGCTRDGCGNVIGRVEFNPGRVRTHFIHTIMRMELEKKQTQPGGALLSGMSSLNSVVGVNGSDEIDLNCDTNSSNRQWLPHIRMPDYSQTNAYTTSTPPLTTPDPTTSSSHSSNTMDLYVYRDDYPSVLDNRLSPHSLYHHTSHYTTQQSHNPANSLPVATSSALSFNQSLDYGAVVDSGLVNQHIRFVDDDVIYSSPQTASNSLNYLHSSTTQSPPPPATITTTIANTAESPNNINHFLSVDARSSISSNSSNRINSNVDTSEQKTNDTCVGLNNTKVPGFLSLHPPDKKSNSRHETTSDEITSHRYSDHSSTSIIKSTTTKTLTNNQTVITTSTSTSSSSSSTLVISYEKNSLIDKLNNDIKLVNNNSDLSVNERSECGNKSMVNGEDGDTYKTNGDKNNDTEQLNEVGVTKEGNAERASV